MREECLLAEEFLSRCRDEGLNITATDAHIALYKELVRLDKENKNGIWARIIKNNFAPLFVGRVDYVAGNPPWVNWESLPGEYRESTLPVWDYYKLRPEKGQLGKMRGGKKDLSMLFVYCGVDNYLKPGGKLGFVITQTVFKTIGAGDGFRQFRFSHNSKLTVLRPCIVHDLSNMQVFEGATNRTAVFVCGKDRESFSYPVPYVVWGGVSFIDQDETFQHVLETTERRSFEAAPVEAQRDNSPWLTAPALALTGIRKVVGRSGYAAHGRSEEWGPQWMLLDSHNKDAGQRRPRGGKPSRCGENYVLERVQATVEPDLVYPLLRGREVERWHVESSSFYCCTTGPGEATRRHSRG